MTEAQMRWLATRPRSVQVLAAEFPLDCLFIVKGVTMYLMAYRESGDLVVTPINPAVDYEAAMAARQPLCIKHIRDGDVEVIHPPRSFAPPGG